MKCPALVSQPEMFLMKTPITSAGMSHQAMTTFAMVGCLYFFHPLRFDPTHQYCIRVEWLLSIVASPVVFAPAVLFMFMVYEDILVVMKSSFLSEESPQTFTQTASLSEYQMPCTSTLDF